MTTGIKSNGTILNNSLLSVTYQSSDEDLFSLIKKGCHSSFEALFRKYYENLCQQAFKLIHCEYRAQEIVSDVFTKVWNNREVISINTKIKYYLYTAVRNQTVDYLRKQVRERKFSGEIKQDYESGYTTPDQEIIGKEFSVLVEAAIESLPPQGKHIFRLSRDEGMKYREIAEMLGISIKTVETHMRRSLIHLRAQIFGAESN